MKQGTLRNKEMVVIGESQHLFSEVYDIFKCFSDFDSSLNAGLPWHLKSLTF